MTKQILSESPRRPSLPPPVRTEYGDAKDVRVAFGIRTTFLYQLMYDGLIESVVVKGRGNSRGKRLFKFSSIRKLLASQQQPQQGEAK